MSYIDIKYARLVGGRMDLFKEKNSNLYNLDAPTVVTLRSRSPKLGVIFSLKVVILSLSAITVLSVEPWVIS